MASGCGDVLSIEDLKTAKKHQLFEAEVITGKQGGVASGADIDFATNQATGQTQKTLPAVLRDAGFTPVSWDFSTGGTLSSGDRGKVVYDPVSKTWYSYSGALPVTIPAGFNPVGDANWKPQTDPNLRDDLGKDDGFNNIGSFNYAGLRAYSGDAERVYCYGRENVFDKASGFFHKDPSDTASADNDGTIIVDADGGRWKRQYSGRIDVRWFGVKADGDNDDTEAANNALALRLPCEFPAGDVVISSPLIFATQEIYGAGTSPIPGQGTVLQCQGKFSAFRHLKSQYNVGGIIRGFWINFGEEKPTDDVDGNSVGVNFGNLNEDPYPNGSTHFVVEDIVVRGSYWGFFDQTTSYLMEYRNCWAWNCFVGFRKTGGTTVKYSTCYSNFCYSSWWVDDCQTLTLTNCAYDGSETFGSLKPFNINRCYAVTITGIQHEYSKITTAGASDFVATDCVAVNINGFAIPSYQVEVSNTSAEVYMFDFVNTKAEITGLRIAPTGGTGQERVGSDGANTVGVIARSGSVVNVRVSNIPSMPGANNSYSLYSAGSGIVNYDNSVDFGGTTVGGLVLKSFMTKPGAVAVNTTVPANGLVDAGNVSVPGLAEFDILETSANFASGGCSMVATYVSPGVAQLVIINHTTTNKTLLGIAQIRARKV